MTTGFFTDAGIVVLCLSHRQRVTLSFFEGSARLRHESVGDICDGQRFVVREQEHVTRNIAVAKLAGEAET